MANSSPNIVTTQEMAEKLRLWQRHATAYHSGATSLNESDCATSLPPVFNTSSDKALSSSSAESESFATNSEIVGRHNPEMCLNEKPIFYQFYDLDELPGSQSTFQGSNDSVS